MDADIVQRRRQLSRAIRKKLAESGKTASELAREIGATKQAMSLIYLGDAMPRFHTACMIADALGCTLDELAGRKCQ